MCYCCFSCLCFTIALIVVAIVANVVYQSFFLTDVPLLHPATPENERKKGQRYTDTESVITNAKGTVHTALSSTTTTTDTHDVIHVDILTHSLRTLLSRDFFFFFHPFTISFPSGDFLHPRFLSSSSLLFQRVSFLFFFLLLLSMGVLFSSLLFERDYLLVITLF